MRVSIVTITLVVLINLSVAFAETPADMIFVGGNIDTSNIHQPEVEALAISSGRISAVGDREDVLALKGDKTKVIDLNGRALLPGFVGAHTHPIFFMRSLTEQFSVRPERFKDFNSIIDALNEEAKKGDVVAWGYDGALIKNSKKLDFDVLDQVSTKNSVIVIGLSAHEAFGNHVAFKRAGITEDTKNPPGGSLGRDKNGRLTGASYEVPGVMLLLAGIKTKTDFRELAKTALEYYAEHGFTTITVPGLGIPVHDSQTNLKVLKEAALAKDAPVRVQGDVISELLDKIPELMKENNNDRFRVLGVKIWADGSTQDHTAALIEDYADKKSKGKVNYTQEAYNKFVATAHDRGLQIATHANGDRGVNMVFDAIEAAQAAHHRDDARHRIEHFTVTNRDALKRAKNAGITPTFLNQHIYNWGHVFEKRLGEERASTIDPAGSAERLGMNFSFHDDAPTGLPKPMLMMQVAVTRQMREGGILNADERIPIDRAIRALTLDPAWQSFIEKTRGSLEMGKYADLVVLSANPRKTDANAIMDIEVLETWVDGRIAFKKAK